MEKQLYAGNLRLIFSSKTVLGKFVNLNGELFYKISNYDAMKPFFMSIVSPADHWLYIWSNGALTAGRKNADHALFPYYTDDKILDGAEFTGSKTILRILQNHTNYLWEPFSERFAGAYHIERHLYKSIYGNKLIFEEINHDLNLAFRYAWLSSDRFGFIKKSTLLNRGNKPATIELIDGIQNILPAGVKQSFQNEFSTLVDAYKKNELEPDCALGLFTLSSIPVDRAEPSESLRATTVWSTGVTADQILLSSRQLDRFRKGLPVQTEKDIRAARGAYFVNTTLQLKTDEEKVWYIIAEVDQDSARVASLKHRLQTNQHLVDEVESDIEKGTEELIRIIARADGLQKSADPLTTSRHYSNVLFNVMRGGIFEDGYLIDKNDLLDFLSQADKTRVELYRQILTAPDEPLSHPELLKIAQKSGNAEFERLCYEYLPLSFSRRHGDPSRPWNKFSIEIRDEKGNKKRNYQGNWRDIFQNWEALAMSFPEFLESMITRFLNASTADGYNPYRITRVGIDWEVMDPNDPWSYIGYWGDHQIIYLTKLLEMSHNFHPGRLSAMLSKRMYIYADVPYRIKPYQDIVNDPHNTVDFDFAHDRKIKHDIEEKGERARYLHDPHGKLYQVTLSEKLLVPVLAKLSNFIPEAGIWLNTQRPEWNDANNALVGYGASVVTLYYLHRHIHAIITLIESSADTEIIVSCEVAQWLDDSAGALQAFKDRLRNRFSDTDRKMITDKLGQAGSKYRMNLYKNGFSGQMVELKPREFVDFLYVLLEFIDQSIRANRRDDQLYHTYNLISIEDEAIRIRYLYEMLEGQVAVLSSGLLSAEESVDLLNALRQSKLYRDDQSTYLLYPDRRLPRFTEKNNIPQSEFERSELLQELIRQGNTEIVVPDTLGGVHFNGDFRNAVLLNERLKKLPDEYQPLVERESGLITAIYEQMFDHQSFTGRSGTFFKYEGLGSTYWHMVSKLALAVQESYFRAIKEKADDQTIQQLRQYYHELKEGIGVHKSPDHYGAFPTDPYSHTPGHSGVQQPGMTGQVKEDILSRFGELGLSVHDGKIHFQKGLFSTVEFLKEPEWFHYNDVSNVRNSIYLEPQSLAFTFCQVPVVYHLSDEEQIILTYHSGEVRKLGSLILDNSISKSLFNREGKFRRIDVFFRETES